jgi:predicted metal-dependent hydrolase
MSAISFGNTELDYSIRLSPKAQKKRIEITPRSIDVIAPESTPHTEILSFLQEKTKDVFIAQEKLKARNRSFFQEKDQFFSGGKVWFRGRRLAVRVEYGDGEKPALSYKSRFYITLPRTVAEEKKEGVVGGLVNDWLLVRLLEDSAEMANDLGSPLSLTFKAVRVRQQKHIWATCGKDGILYINFLLVKTPRKVLEYVIAHELAHLTYRNHSDKFWALVGKMVPDYKVYQDILDGL